MMDLLMKLGGCGSLMVWCDNPDNEGRCFLYQKKRRKMFCANSSLV
jgi:hypothetical protein